MSKRLVSSEVLQLHNFSQICCSSTFLWTVTYLSFHNCCSMYKWVMATLLLLLVARDRAISSKFLTRRVVQDCPIREKFQFSPLMVAILDFSGKWKSVNISKTVQDRAISSKLFDPQGSTRSSILCKGEKFQFS